MKLKLLGSRPSKDPALVILRFKYGPCVKEIRIGRILLARREDMDALARHMRTRMKRAVKVRRLGFVPVETTEWSAVAPLYPPYTGAPPLTGHR